MLTASLHSFLPFFFFFFFLASREHSTQARITMCRKSKNSTFQITDLAWNGSARQCTRCAISSDCVATVDSRSRKTNPAQHVWFVPTIPQLRSQGAKRIGVQPKKKKQRTAGEKAKVGEGGRWDVGVVGLYGRLLCSLSSL